MIDVLSSRQVCGHNVPQMPLSCFPSSLWKLYLHYLSWVSENVSWLIYLLAVSSTCKSSVTLISKSPPSITDLMKPFLLQMAFPVLQKWVHISYPGMKGVPKYKPTDTCISIYFPLYTGYHSSIQGMWSTYVSCDWDDQETVLRTSVVQAQNGT